ncbi:MAG: hypothetical protein ACTSRE_08700 [Promethearchaeota archaeon]
MAKRLVSMDMLRGWAILLMVIFHVFLNVSDLVHTPIPSMGIGSLILVAFIAIFIHWQTFFMMISAVVHWFTMSKMYKNGQSLGKIFFKQLIFGVALYIFGFLREPFLSPWGMTLPYFASGGLLGGGTWSWDRWTFLYRAETLSNIGFSVMVTAVIFVALAALNKTKLKEKARTLIKVGILAAIAAVFIFLAPMVHNWVNVYSGVDTLSMTLQTGETHWQSGLDLNNGYFNRWLLNSLGGREFPLFPNYANFLVGCSIGVLLSQEKPSRKILRYTLIAGLVLTLGGAAYWLFVDDFLSTLNVYFHIHPTGFIIFSLGLQMIIVTLALRFYEFNPKMLEEKRQKLMLKLSRWIRRWGMFALTIFVFNIIEFLPRGILTEINPAVDYRAGNLTLPWTLLMVGILLVLWEGIIRLICFAKGYASIEFVFLALFKLGKKPIKKDPLNIQGNLREVEPILFVSRE